MSLFSGDTEFSRVDVCLSLMFDESGDGFAILSFTFDFFEALLFLRPLEVLRLFFRTFRLLFLRLFPRPLAAGPTRSATIASPSFRSDDLDSPSLFVADDEVFLLFLPLEVLRLLFFMDVFLDFRRRLLDFLCEDLDFLLGGPAEIVSTGIILVLSTLV